MIRNRMRQAALLAAATTTLTACAGSGPGVDRAFGVNGLVAPAAARHVRPVLAGTTLTGTPLDVRSWRGHVVVVNIWGSWCAPCRKEAPQLARAAAATTSEGVRFVGIDVRDDRQAAIAFEKHFGIRYPSLSDRNASLLLQFGPLNGPAVPYTFVLDGQGRVASRFIGPVSYQPLHDTIELIRAGSVPAR